MEWILYTILLVHYSLKHTAVILVSPDEDFWDGSQGFHQQTSVTLSHSLILAQQTMEISIKRADRCTWIISGNHAPHSVLLSTYINLEKKNLNENEYDSTTINMHNRCQLPTLDIASLVNLHVHVFVYDHVTMQRNVMSVHLVSLCLV